MVRKKMKRLFAALFSLMLAGALAACSSDSEAEAPDSPAPPEASAPEQTPAPAGTEKPEATAFPAPAQTSEPKQTPRTDEPPEPENTPQSGALRASNEEIVSDVRVCHVADDAFNRPGLAPYEVVDLNDVGAYHEFADPYRELAEPYDPFPRIIFMTDAPVKNFCYFEIETTLDDDMGMAIADTLYRLDELTPEKPFVANWISIGDIGMSRGISFEDADGVARYFGFNVSGDDGDMYLIEFKPE